MLKLKRRKFAIKKKDFWLTVAFMMLMEPAVFSQFQLIDSVFTIGKVLAALYTIWFLLFRKEKRTSFSTMQIVLSLYFLSFIISTIHNNGDVIGAVRTVVFNWIGCLLLDSLIRTDSVRTIHNIKQLMIFFMVVNLILLLLFPRGFGAYVASYSMSVDARLNFLGRDNAFIYFFILAIVLCFLDSKDKKETLPVIILTMITMVSVWSGTGLVGCSIIILYALFGQDRWIEKIFNIRVLTIANVVMFLLIVLLRRQELFATLITNILGKDVTLTGRTDLWDMAIMYFLRNPIWGYGITENFLVAKSGIAYSPHDLYLQILLAGGVIAMFFFLIAYGLAAVKIGRGKYRYGNLLAVAIFAYLTASITESTMNTQYLYFMFVIACNLGLIEKNKEAKEKDA